jgi:hypothetical protein
MFARARRRLTRILGGFAARRADLLLVAGLALVVTGVWHGFGQTAGLIAAGVACLAMAVVFEDGRG